MSQYILRPRLSVQILQMSLSAACPARWIFLSLLHALRLNSFSRHGFVEVRIRESRHSFQGLLAELTDKYKKLKSGTSLIRNPVAISIVKYHHHFHLIASHKHDKRYEECQPSRVWEKTHTLDG